MKANLQILTTFLVCNIFTINIFASEITLTQKLTGVTPEPQQVYIYEKAHKPFKISPDSIIMISEVHSPLYKQAVNMIDEDMKTAYSSKKILIQDAPFIAENHLFLCNDKQNAKKTYTENLAILETLPAPGRDVAERYQLIINSNGILLSAPADKGLFYAVQTLRQLLTQNGDIPAIVISDWPDQDIRASYGISSSMNMEAYIRKLASLKMNMAIMESSWNANGNWWYNPTGANLAKGKEFFRICQKYNIEPVPFIQGFGWAYGVVGIDPHCAEGIWVRNEEYILSDSKDCIIKNPNVIMTKTAPIIVKNADNKYQYQDGKDYRIIPGYTGGRFRKSNKPWKIVRMPKSQIKDGETVLISYNYMNYCKSQTPYCPMEPKTYKIIARVLKMIIEIYNPQYIHIGHDEVRYINRCSRCQQSGLNREQIIERDINYWNDTIKKLNPSIKIMIWSDLFVNKSNAEDQILGSVSKDMIICPWGYRGTEQAKLSINSRLKLLIDDKKRVTLGAASGYDNNNIWIWKEAFEKYNNNPKALGFMFTYWGETERIWSSLSFAAEYMWSRQKPDRNVFDLYNAANIMFRKEGLGLGLDINKQMENITKRVVFDILAGRDVLKNANDLDKDIAAIVKEVNKKIIPALSNADYAKRVNNERQLVQMENLSENYKALVSDTYKKQGVNKIEFYGNKYIQLQITDIEDMKLTKNGNTVTYNLGFPRYLSKLELNASSSAKVDISLSNHKGEYIEPDKLEYRVVSPEIVELSCVPQQTENIRITSPQKVSINNLFALKKQPEYVCKRVEKSSAQWTEDLFWKDIPQAEDFVTRIKSKNESKKLGLALSGWETTAKTIYDNSNLYVRTECYFPDVRMLEYNKDKVENSATQIWDSDCIQLFIQPEKAFRTDSRSFYQLIVDAGGRVLMRCHYMNPRKTEIAVKCRILQNKWICNIKIPLKWFEANSENLYSQNWKINFGRTQVYPRATYSSWAMLPPGTMLWFLQAKYFGDLKFQK
jgi:hypothetical protein